MSKVPLMDLCDAAIDEGNDVEIMADPREIKAILLKLDHIRKFCTALTAREVSWEIRVTAQNVLNIVDGLPMKPIQATMVHDDGRQEPVEITVGVVGAPK